MLSLRDALPISERQVERRCHAQELAAAGVGRGADAARGQPVPGDDRLLRGCQRAEQRREVVGVAVVGIDEVGQMLEIARQRDITAGREILLQRHVDVGRLRSEEHTSELQSLMRISYAVFCLKKKKYRTNSIQT